MLFLLLNKYAREIVMFAIIIKYVNNVLLVINTLKNWWNVNQYVHKIVNLVKNRIVVITVMEILNT